MFNVNGVEMSGSDLRALSYVVAKRGTCLAIVNRTPVTCAPPDYWGEEYYPYEEERRGDGKKGRGKFKERGDWEAPESERRDRRRDKDSDRA